VQLLVTLSDLRLTRTEQRLILTRLIGQPRGSADWQLDPWQAPPALVAGESAWLDAALVNRPEIQSKTWELAALGDDVDATAFAPLSGGSVGIHGEHDPVWRVGPNISSPIPIFDFGQESRAKARAMQFAARQDLAQQRLIVIEEVRRAFATFVASLDALDQAQNQLLPLQEQQHQLAEEAFQSGDTDLATLLLSENDLQSTRTRVVELQAKVAAALVKLRRAAGGAAIAAKIESAASANSIAPSTKPSVPSTEGSPPVSTSRPDAGSLP
jgi:outer membrane protein TolC